ncbi:MAG TPA: hypothetical protein VEZ12_05120, partial [Herpetosiphonaceae bacterium]|nr:hypothetical protein [Herpetosiphonaceae bacterium]
ACQVSERGTWCDYVLAGLLLGLAAATKYQSGFVVVSLIAAHLLRWRGASVRYGGRLLLAGVVSVLVFLLCSPFVLLNFAGFARDIRTLLASYEQAHGDVVGAWPLGAYATFVVQELLGVLPALFAAVGVALLLRRRPAPAVVLLAFPVVLVALLLRPQTHFWRNLLPIEPPLLLIAAAGAAGTSDLLRFRVPTLPRRAAGVLVLGLLLIPPSIAAARQSTRLALPDSRIAAQELIRTRFPGVRVASELSHQMMWNGISQATGVEYLPLHPAQWYREQGYGLLLASSTPRRSFEWTEPYRPLLAQTRPVATFGAPGSRYRGPQVDVLDTGLSPDDAGRSANARVGSLQLHGVTLGRLLPGTTAETLEPADELAAGERLGLLVYWSRVEPAPAAPYTLFVHLRDATGNNLSQFDAAPWSGLFSPPAWPAGSTVVDRLAVPLPPSLPPGSYRLVVGLYDAATLGRFPLLVAGQRLGGDEIEIGAITIRP